MSVYTDHLDELLDEIELYESLERKAHPDMRQGWAKLIKGTVEEAVRFSEQVSPHSRVLDTTALSLPGIDPAMRAEVTPIVLGVLCSRLAEHFESVSGHSLDDRRYMGRMAY